MGWKSCLFLLATLGVFVIMVGECMANAGPEQVHKLPTDDHDHTKRSSDGEAVDGVQKEGVEQSSVEEKEILENGTFQAIDGSAEFTDKEKSGNQHVETIDQQNPDNQHVEPTAPPKLGNSIGDLEESLNKLDGILRQPAGKPKRDDPPAPPTDPQQQPVPPAPPADPQQQHGNGDGDDSKIPDPLHKNFVVHYDKDSGNCYYGMNGPEAKEAAVAKNKDKMANGKIKIQDNDALPICMADFDEMARKKSCGMPKYDQMVYCAKVQFYGEKGLEEAKKYMETNDPKTFDEFQKNYMQNNIFVFVDGCLQCDDTKTTAKATVEFWHIHPAGPIAEPKVCPEEEEKVNKGEGVEKMFEVDGKVSKTVPYISGTMLKERLCVSRPNMESDAMMKLSYKYKAKIVVKHTCGGGDEMKEHTVMFGTTIEKDKLNNNVFHLRNLKIVLEPINKNKTETIEWDWNEKKKGLGYFYYEPKGVKDSNGGIVLTQEDIEKEMNQLDMPI